MEQSLHRWLSSCARGTPPDNAEARSTSCGSSERQTFSREGKFCSLRYGDAVGAKFGFPQFVGGVD